MSRIVENFTWKWDIMLQWYQSVKFKLSGLWSMTLVVRVQKVEMSMLQPNDNTILWNQTMALPRCITRASSNFQKGAINGLPMNPNARAKTMRNS